MSSRVGSSYSLHLPLGQQDMDDDASSDENIDSPEDEYDDEIEGLDVLKPCLRALGLSRSYVYSWTCQDAFRELYQNWKDAIVASFNLDPRSFKPKINITTNEIQILAKRHRPSERSRDREELLGFIRFNKKAGSLELTNFNAQLGPQHLSLGGTTKRGHDRFVGVHGEGFKLAALVLCRNRLAVRFQASSHYWNFCFRGVGLSNFYCRIARPKEEVLKRKKEKFRRKCETGARKGLTANIWEDVSVKITKGRGESGPAISEAEFESWLKVAIELDQPESKDIVETDHGDLILKEEFRGRIYLKGLLVSVESSDRTGYSYGYNFVRGRINRDRERMMDREEESQMLAMIWEQSITSRGDSITKKYLKLLRGSHRVADIAMVEEKVTITTAETLWRQLRTEEPNTFFFPIAETSDLQTLDQENIIRNSLKKTPTPMPLVLWNILRKYSLVRSPQEEKVHRFAHSQTIKVKDDVFSVGVQRALKAALLLDPRLEDINIQFAKGGGTDIDLLFKEEEKVLLVHEKWANFETIHQTFSCETFRLSQRQSGKDFPFLCDHIAEDLIELTLNDIQGPLQLPPTRCMELRRKARERIQQTPRLIKVSRTNHPNELEVSWIGNESGLISQTYGSSIQYHVMLHRMSTCRSKKNNLLHKIVTSETISGISECGCTYQVVAGFSKKAVFKGLEEGEEYFPMVSRQENNSFFGLPPAPSTPKTAPIPSIAPHLSFQAETNSHVITIDDDDAESPPNGVENSQQVEGTGQGGPNNTSIPRGRPTSSEHKQHRVSNTRTAEVSAWQEDDKVWQIWHEQELPSIFAQWTSRDKLRPERTASTVSNLSCPHLGYKFEKDEYARVCIDPEGAVNHVILVHDICISDSDPSSPSYYLLVTKYSPLQSTLFFNARNLNTSNDSARNGRELLLHFENFNTMGQAADAEAIWIEDIISANNISSASPSSDSIDYVREPLQNAMTSGFFCRFAFCTAEGGKTACITPVSSSLLQRKDRWRPVKFTCPPNPLVFDLTPNVLGPAEGFSQAGYSIHSAIGFDPERHLTWKMRHSTSEFYDGPPLSVLDDFHTGRLEPISSPFPSTPRIALVAGENTPFRLSDRNILMSSRENFLKPLDVMDAAAQSPLKPDFLVLLNSPAILHRSTISRLSESIFKLLEQRLSVHLKLSPLQDYGIRQSRSILTLVASPVCASLPWQHEGPINGPRPSAKVEDIISDLAFVNPRARQSYGCRLVCNSPNSPATNMPIKAVYNHQTGRSPLFGVEPANLDLDVIALSRNSTETLVHPKRKDLLTVRELARFQGFEDSFVFYHSIAHQHWDVINATPPIVARHVANAIFRVIQGFRAVRLDDPRVGQRVNKRARVEESTEV